ALTPRTDHAKASKLDPSESPTKDIALPDAVRDAPDSNADLAKVPRLGQPLSATPPSSPRTVANTNPPDGIRQAIREERTKALLSPILVDLESPTGADRAGALPNPPSGAAPAVLSAAPAPPAAVAAAGADPNMQQHKADFFSREG